MENYKDPNILCESIGNAAKELFNHYGFKKTSMDDIAGKARIAKGTIYNYFKNKDELIRYVMRKEGETYLSLVNEGILNQKTPQLKLREMIIIKIKFLKEMRLFFPTTYKTAVEILSIAMEFLPVVADDIKESARKEMEIVEGILEEGINSSVFRPINIQDTARVIMLAVKGFELEWGFQMDIEQAIAELDGMLEIIFKGLEKRPKK